MDDMATTMKQTEEQLQAECFLWYYNKYRFDPIYSKMLHHNDNNSYNKVVGARKKALGVVSGVSDFELTTFRQVHYIEMKIPDGKQSDEQKVFQFQVESLGFPYIILYSFVDFQNYIYAALATSEQRLNNSI